MYDKTHYNKKKKFMWLTASYKELWIIIFSELILTKRETMLYPWYVGSQNWHKATPWEDRISPTVLDNQTSFSEIQTVV